jgi:hypothetical protein
MLLEFDRYLVFVERPPYHGRDRMIVGFTTTHAISAYPGQWFSPGPLVSSTNKTDRHDIAEILLKVT